jgi:hypothetical protein
LRDESPPRRNAGRFLEVIEQCLLFRFRFRELTRLLGASSASARATFFMMSLAFGSNSSGLSSYLAPLLNRRIGSFATKLDELTSMISRDLL